jgi:hypothetical protein
MNQLLLIGSLVAIVIAILVVRLKKPKRPKRWMPDIRRVI